VVLFCGYCFFYRFIVNFICGIEQLAARKAQIRVKIFLMSTKLKGDIAEQAAILKILELGWGVSKPLGDRLSYDLIADINGKLVKLQVKSAWFNASDQNYCIDVRRTKTNRRQMLRSLYSEQDFDFALVYLQEKHIFYVFPVKVFIGFGSTLSLVETDKRQRKPKSANYREAFELISQWAPPEVTLA
jgi:PD-(D/E)XK endonuclease